MKKKFPTGKRFFFEIAKGGKSAKNRIFPLKNKKIEKKCDFFQKTICKIIKTHVYYGTTNEIRLRQLLKVVLWCNGSTSDSGSLC